MASAIQPPAIRGQGRTPRPGAPSRTAADTGDVAPAPSPTSLDDSGLGLALFLIFITAVLVITGAVAFLTLFNSWWMLGLVFGLDLLVTFGVGTTVFSVLGDRKLGARGKAPVLADAEPGVNTPIRARKQVPRAPIPA